jgi:protein required for attachment to host cells
MKAVTTWILIADSTQARIACNEGPGRGVKPVFEEVLHGRNLPGREINADRPGRAFDSAGLGRHAKEPPTDPRENEKQHFIRELAALLDKGAKQGRYDRLVLVAPPKALGQLRATISDAVRAKVSGELDKDLVHVSMHQLAGHLGGVLAV